MRVHPVCGTCYCQKPPTWRKFVYDYRESYKFWDIKQEGMEVYTRFGRVGTSGSTIVKNFYSSYDAKDYVNRMINEKLNKGYEEL
jgi:predicted DNA-binding WGR domain protein